MRAKWRNHRACSTSIHPKPDATSSPCTPQLQDSCRSRKFKRFLHYSCTASVESRVAAGPLPGWRGLPTNGKYWSHAPLHVGFRVKNPALRSCLRRQKVHCTGPASDSLRLKQGEDLPLAGSARAVSQRSSLCASHCRASLWRVDAD